jgi:hypothetical protein
VWLITMTTLLSQVHATSYVMADDIQMNQSASPLEHLTTKNQISKIAVVDGWLETLRDRHYLQPEWQRTKNDGGHDQETTAAALFVAC